MERPGPNPYQESEQKLRKRFNKAIQPIPRGRIGEKRSLAKTDTDRFLPSNLDLSEKSSSEIMVMLFEKLRSFQTQDDRAPALKALSDALRAADYLVDTLPGNDAGNKFYHEAKDHLEKINAPLNEKFEEIMNGSEERADKRRELARRWRQNQKPTEIVYERK